MRPLCTLAIALLAAGALAFAGPSQARDVDGGPDCQLDKIDWGDAPEEVLAYPGVPGRFPTCSFPGPAGTQNLNPVCPPISTLPGPTGHVTHIQFGPTTPGNYWLGCYFDATGAAIGIDSESDGKTNQPSTGLSFCNSTLLTDCVEAGAGLLFDQDECYLDGSDAGVKAPPVLLACKVSAVTFETFNCGQNRTVFLNVLIDMNQDGDWNDNDICVDDAGNVLCAYEWAVKNATLVLPPGCAVLTTPPFLVGPRPGPGWMRITISDDPVTDDFPWAGSALLAGGELRGGETEDYPVEIEKEVPSETSTWGRVKNFYR